jgi:O-succinylbenzoic acid--CoA ligase
LVFEGRTITWAELSAQADSVAHSLAAAGVLEGDRVALLLRNRPLYAALLHGVARLGAVLVPLNTRLTAVELEWQVQQAEPKVIVVEEQWRGLMADLVSDASVILLPHEMLAPGVSHSEAAFLDAVSPGAPQLIVYTSGTSGRPKGAVISHGATAWSASLSASRLGADPNDRWLVPLPLFHVGGLAVLVRSAWYGTAALLMQRFDAVAVAAAMHGGEATLVSLVPTMLERVLDEWPAGSAPEQLRAVLLGGGPVTQHLLDRAAAVGLPIALTYGLTEAGSQVATAVPTRRPRLSDGVPPLVCTDLRIAASAGESRPLQGLEEGREGVIEVRSPAVMSGYWRAPEASARVLSGGWLRTGDIGFLDDRGWLHPLGRRHDLIVTGGENVYPAEVEAALERHPEVERACVVGLSDPLWGAVVVAAVVRCPGTRPTAEELDALARRHLASYKVPRAYVWVDSLPTTASGKVARGVVAGGIDLAHVERPQEP